MNLTFGVLWIEDFFEPQEKKNLEDRIMSAGFAPEITSIPNSSGIEELAKQHRLFHRFDLILLDWKLQGEDGTDLAPRVRELFPATTILFYSGNGSHDDLRKEIADRRVEGVYCSPRERFRNVAGDLVEQMAGSLNRLTGMRGLAVEVVAECDAAMRKAVLAMHDKHERCSSLLEKLDGDVEDGARELADSYGRARQGDLRDRLATRSVDSAKLYKHFRRSTKAALSVSEAFQLDEPAKDELRSLHLETADYDEKVIRKRNSLGHAREVRSETGWTLEDSGGIDVGDFPELRRNFASQLQAIKRMVVLLAPDGDEGEKP